VGPFWAHTGYDPVFEGMRSARLTEGVATVQDLGETYGLYVERAGVVLHDDVPYFVNRNANTAWLVRLGTDGWEEFGTDSAGYFEVTPWVGDDGQLRLTLWNSERASTRIFDGSFVEDPGEITELPGGYAFTQGVTSESGRNPIWILEDTTAEERTYVPATLDCGADACTWNVGAPAAMTTRSASHRFLLAGQTAGGTAVVVEADAAEDPDGEGWINRILVTWPGGQYVENDMGPNHEIIDVAARPTEGFVVAMHQRYGDQPIVLLVFDAMFDVTRWEVDVDRDVRNSLEVMTEATADGEVVHLITPLEELVTIYTLDLETAERTVRTFDMKP
jgi:hypothetical protein